MQNEDIQCTQFFAELMHPLNILMNRKLFEIASQASRFSLQHAKKASEQIAVH